MSHLQLVISAHHMVYAAAVIFIVWALIAFRWEIVSAFMQGVCKTHYQPYKPTGEK
jgi:hypothetical protein